MLEAFIIFRVGEARYAVRSVQVQQVEMITQVTPVPNAPHFVDGVVYVRGQVVPVINLRRRFGLEKIPYDSRSRLIVVRLEKRVVGLAADAAHEFTRLDTAEMYPVPEGLAGPGSEYLEGILTLKDELVMVVDLQQVLTFHERESLEEPVQAFEEETNSPPSS